MKPDSFRHNPTCERIRVPPRKVVAHGLAAVYRVALFVPCGTDVLGSSCPSLMGEGALYTGELSHGPLGYRFGPAYLLHKERGEAPSSFETKIRPVYRVAPSNYLSVGSTRRLLANHLVLTSVPAWQDPSNPLLRLFSSSTPLEEAVVFHPPVDHLREITVRRQGEAAIGHDIPVDVPAVAIRGSQGVMPRISWPGRRVPSFGSVPARQERRIQCFWLEV